MRLFRFLKSVIWVDVDEADVLLRNFGARSRVAKLKSESDNIFFTFLIGFGGAIGHHDFNTCAGFCVLEYDALVNFNEIRVFNCFLVTANI